MLHVSEAVREIAIDSRFSGPPGLGNGGYVAGVLARALRGAARVTLRAPIPLDTPLALAVLRGAGTHAAHRAEGAGRETGRTVERVRPPAPGAGNPVGDGGSATPAGGRAGPESAGGVGADTEGGARTASGRKGGFGRNAESGPAEACRVELRHGETLLAEAAPAALDLAPPPAPDRAAAVAATGRYPGRAPNPYRECFVCGFAREPGSGLRVFAGPTGTPGLVAADWTVHPGLADEDGAVPEEFLWGALDCPGAYAAGGAEPRNLRLGRMTARVFGGVRAGERCTVAGWRIGSERRKHFTGTAVYGEAGNVAALAAATWIAPRTEDG